MIIAIDGPAGAGKSSVARRVAAALGLRFLDTGSMYRAVALEVLRRGLDASDEAACARVAGELRLEFDTDGRLSIDGRPAEPDIRSDAVGAIVSSVAEHAGVRAAIVPLQRAFAERWGGAVAEGRDMGSVVFPQAEHKFYLDASSRARALRRARQLGQPERVEHYRAEVEARDRIDSTRRCAPLRRVPEAVYIDSDDQSEDEVVRRVLECVRGPSAPAPPARAARESTGPRVSESDSDSGRAAIAPLLGGPLIAHATPVYRFGRNLTAGVLRVYNRLRVEGAEHIPREGPVLLVANHQSFLDIPVVAAGTRRHVCFVARDTLARSRFLAWVMRHSGVVLVRRGAADRPAIEEMIAHLKAGDAVAIFPEGTRSQDGSLGEFRPGYLLVARRGGAPVIPVGIRGTIDALSRAHRVPRPAPVRVAFGPPVDARDPDAALRVREAVAALVGDGRAQRLRTSVPPA